MDPTQSGSGSLPVGAPEDYPAGCGMPRPESASWELPGGVVYDAVWGLSERPAVTARPESGLLPAFLGRASDAVFIVRRDFRILYWSPRAEQLLGIPASRAVGRHCFDVVCAHHSVARAQCGPQCWVMHALWHGNLAPTFAVEVPGPKNGAGTYTLGFFADEAGELLVHILRGPDPDSRPDTPPDAAESDSSAGGELTRVSALSDREREVLRFIMAGATSREIADRLTISHATARNHTQNVLAKLGVHSRAEAAVAGLNARLEPRRP